MSRRFIASRRGGARGVGSGGGPVRPMLGLRGFTASTDYASTATGIAGDAAGFWKAVLFSPDSQAVASASRTLDSKIAGTPNGYEFRTTGTHSALVFSATSGAGGFISAPSFTLTAGHMGKDVLAVGVHTGSVLRLYVDAVESGSGTAITGYTASANAQRMGGRAINTQPASDTVIYGCAGGHGVPSLAQVQQYFADVKAARALVAMAGVTTGGAWNVVSATSVVDSVAADNMTVTGTLTLVTRTTKAWSW
jgi:hypothetical protein